MAVFSRIVVLAACLVSSALFVDANTENIDAGGQVTARHLKHPQPRAHHAHVAHAHNKRSDDKKRACAAKDESVKKVTTTTKHATTTPHATTTTHRTTTTTKKATSTPNTQTSYSGVKAGLGWNDGQQSFMKNLKPGDKTSWIYTWSPWKAGFNGIEFVPMLWSGKQVSDWNKNVAGKEFDHVLAFNEPEISGQSEMAVGEAVSLWWKYIEPMSALHGAPAVTTSPKGNAWLKQFMNECSGCKIDFICLHWYGTDANNFIETITEFYNTYKKPVWVTEWACQNYGSNQSQQCSSSQIETVMGETQAWMDQTDWIHRYAWFGALTAFPGNFNTQNRLITSSGALTDLGRKYIS